ncbi:MAG: hypothetical protein A4E35_01250 [Methanoregula sp. PtaU1.Bin051]|nr:MAG: hypothetical protein A4E35_01250 [Methanoregula sp. PtaU1.Bin051]
MRRGSSSYDSAGVSEAIGFVLIFTIVMMGIGLVTLYGYPMLLRQQASADQRIMEKNMIVLQNDIKSICYKSVPYKETSLKVGGGSLAVFSSDMTPQAFNVTINGVLLDTFPLVGNLGELRYRSNSEGMVVTIESGAVIFRQYGQSGSTMLAEPRWFYDTPTHTAVIYMINITSEEMLSESGVGNVQMELGNTSYRSFSDPPFTVGYVPDPENDYSTAWRDYIVNTLGWDETFAGSNIYQLPADAQTLVIKEYDVMIRSL